MSSFNSQAKRPARKSRYMSYMQNHEKKHKHTALAPIFKNTSTQSKIRPRILCTFVQHVHMLLPDFYISQDV